MRAQALLFAAVLLSTTGLMACVEDSAGEPGAEIDEPGTVAPIAVAAPTPVVAGAPCLGDAIESWTGPAGRVNEYYPDNVAVTVTWQRVETVGCVDRYVPTGTAHYSFAIPGALCAQSIDPADAAIRTTDGSLTIDRTTSPTTFVGAAATTWSVTWTCVESDGTTNTSSFEGGGVWFDATGTLAGPSIEGTRTEDDGRQCGQGSSSLPCEYNWAFAAVE